MGGLKGGLRRGGFSRGLREVGEGKLSLLGKTLECGRKPHPC